MNLNDKRTLTPQQLELLKKAESEAAKMVLKDDVILPDDVEPEDEFAFSDPGEDMSLDEELELMIAAGARQAAPVQRTEEAELSPAERMRRDILSLLHSEPDAPSEAQIEAWKKQYGESSVTVLALGPGDVYIFTHLTASQWKKIQEIVSLIQQQGQGNVDGYSLEQTLREKVVRAAVLWPKLGASFFETCRAGIPNTIYDQILLQSYFLQPAQALSLTIQL